jgi:hypothetical protein
MQDPPKMDAGEKEVEKNRQNIEIEIWKMMLK